MRYAGHRDHRNPVGRRGQGQGRRPARRARRGGRALPGRQQRRPHDRPRRRDLQVPPDPVGHPAPGQALRDRQRRRDRPRGAHRRDRRPAPAWRRRQRPARLGQRAPDHAVPRDARLGGRGEARQARDRDHQARDRPLLRGQVRAPRHPRAGPARPEDPAQEDRRGAGAEEAAAAPVRPRPEARPAHHDRGVPPLRPPARAAHRRHVEAVLGSAGRRPDRALRGRPGGDARPRPRHLSLRHLVEPGRRRGLRRRGRRPDRHRRGLGRLQGVRDPRRRRPVPDRAHRRGRRPHARPRPRVRDHDRPRAALRVARPRRAALRDPAQPALRARDHEARRALRARPAAGRGPLPRHARGPCSRSSPTTSRSCTRRSPSTRSCPAGRSDITGCRREADLPREARDYLAAISDSTGVPISLVGVGPGRDEVIGSAAAEALAGDLVGG